MIEEDDDGGGGDEGAPAWMATFSDLATLLLTFFVLLLSFANMDVKNFRIAMGSVKEAMGVDVTMSGEYAARATTPFEMSTAQAVSYISVNNLEKISKAAVKLVKKMVKKRGLGGKVEVLGTSRGIVLRTKEHVLFDPGMAEIEGRGADALGLIADLLNGFTGDVEIQGHTDNVPLNGGRYASNWELSSARATSVLRYLIETYDAPANRLHVAGYADTRPVAPQDTTAGRALNRRVEFVFEYPLIGGTDSQVFKPLGTASSSRPSSSPPSPSPAVSPSSAPSTSAKPD